MKFTTILGIMLVMLIMCIVLFFVVQPPWFYYIIFVGVLAIGSFMMGIGLVHAEKDQEAAKNEIFGGIITTFGVLLVTLLLELGKLII